MGRPERNVDAESGPVAALACELRALRQLAGTPSYRTLAARANYSATVLSRAASGRELPSLAVLLAYAAACGGDPQEWEARWQAAVDGLTGGTGAAPGADTVRTDPADNGLEISPPGWAGRPRAVVVRNVLRNVAKNRYRVLAAVLTMAAVSGWATALAVFAADAGGHAQGRPAAVIGPAAAVPPADLSDGNDPTESGCAPRAVTVAHAAVLLPAAATIAGMPRTAGTAVGLVELRYSPHCHAAWTRVAPLPGYNVASLGSITLTITRRGDGTYSRFRVPVMTTVYGDLLLTRGGCLTAAAEFQFAGGARAGAQTSCWAGS